MIFDRIEWDDHNLDHATVRLTAEEIEQVIWNATMVRMHRKHANRVVFQAATNGGRRAVVIAEIVRDGVRPVTAWEL